MKEPVDLSWTTAAVATADRLIVCDLGRLAADEGWILSLHDFCRKNRALPNDRQVGDLRLAARRFDEAFALARSLKTKQGRALMELGATMLAGRDDCARIAYGEELP